jgi:hypothetical protein
MRRTPLLILLASAVLALPASGAQAAAPSVSVSVDQCGLVGAKKQLGVTFSGEMDGVDGTKTMAIDFELYTRPAGQSGFKREPRGDESVSRRAVAVYQYGPRTFVLPDLATATDYRARMIFRWTATDGDVTTVRRWSGVCRVSPQPDLALGDLTTTASGQPGVQRYAVPVRNDGRADAGAFDVALRIGAEDRPPVTVAGLAAGASQLVTFTAPRCAPGDVLRFSVDPDDRIAEEDERDNVLTVACPS